LFTFGLFFQSSFDGSQVRPQIPSLSPTIFPAFGPSLQERSLAIELSKEQEAGIQFAPSNRKLLQFDESTKEKLQFDVSSKAKEKLQFDESPKEKLQFDESKKEEKLQFDDTQKEKLQFDESKKDSLAKQTQTASVPKTTPAGVDSDENQGPLPKKRKLSEISTGGMTLSTITAPRHNNSLQMQPIFGNLTISNANSGIDESVPFLVSPTYQENENINPSNNAAPMLLALLIPQYLMQTLASNVSFSNIRPLTILEQQI